MLPSMKRESVEMKLCYDTVTNSAPQPRSGMICDNIQIQPAVTIRVMRSLYNEPGFDSFPLLRMPTVCTPHWSHNNKCADNMVCCTIAESRPPEKISYTRAESRPTERLLYTSAESKPYGKFHTLDISKWFGENISRNRKHQYLPHESFIDDKVNWSHLPKGVGIPHVIQEETAHVIMRDAKYKMPYTDRTTDMFETLATPKL